MVLGLAPGAVLDMEPSISTVPLAKLLLAALVPRSCSVLQTGGAQTKVRQGALVAKSLVSQGAKESSHLGAGGKSI